MIFKMRLAVIFEDKIEDELMLFYDNYSNTYYMYMYAYIIYIYIYGERVVCVCICVCNIKYVS